MPFVYVQPELQMAPQSPDIHVFPRAPFGVFQVKSGAERSWAAGQDNGRRIAIVLEAPGRRGELAYCFGRQRIDAVASIKPYYRNAALWAEPLFDADEVRQLHLPALAFHTSLPNGRTLTIGQSASELQPPHVRSKSLAIRADDLDARVAPQMCIKGPGHR